MKALDSAGHYQCQLVKRGYEELGNGLFSKVYSKPHLNVAIKVARHDDWPQYIEWSIGNGYSGTFAPKVYSLKCYPNFYVAIMERLVCTIGELSYHGNTCHRHLRLGAIRQHEDCEATELVEFMKNCRNAGYCNDLHEWNWMLRKDGQIVLTDPTSRHSNSKLRIKYGRIMLSEVQ